MDRQSLKPIDILRHELKALRFMLDRFHADDRGEHQFPGREDFQSEQGRAIYDLITAAPNRDAAEKALAGRDLDDVDIESFLRLSGEHYYTYPGLVRERAAAIRQGRLVVEPA